MNYKRYKNKIGYCDNKNLKGLEHIQGGHYVYIRNVDLNSNKCDVNVITSLENDKHIYDLQKLKQVKKGNIYVIPRYDGNFTRWSGVNTTVIRNVDATKILDLNKKRIKRRHHFMLGKIIK